MKTFAFLRKNPCYERETRRGYPCGQYNGYVGIMMDEDVVPLSYQGYLEKKADTFKELLDDMVSVHGGITFDGHFGKGTEMFPITEMPPKWERYRIIGFDTHHVGDTADKWPFEEVEKETLHLQRQIEDIAGKAKTK